MSDSFGRKFFIEKGEERVKWGFNCYERNNLLRCSLYRHFFPIQGVWEHIAVLVRGH